MSNPFEKGNAFNITDVVEYKEELEQELISDFNDLNEDNEDWDEIDSIEEVDLGSMDEDAVAHYEEVCEFLEEVGDSAISNEETVIAESYFEEYCEDLVKDCGYLPEDLPAFIENNINWKGIASDMEEDYMEVNFDGETYFIRNN